MGWNEADEAWEPGPEGQEAGLTSVRTWDDSVKGPVGSDCLVEHIKVAMARTAMGW